MKAWVLHDIGDIRYEEVDKPLPVSGEVLVEVKACGICGSDIQRVYKDGAHRMPLIIGHEFAGRVCEVGDDKDSGWLDKRVGVYPLIPCGECEPCKKKQYEMCRSYDYLGSRSNGGFAEYVCVPVNNLIELPDNVSYVTAAMLEPMAVAMHAVMRSGMTSWNTCKVIGMGTIGFFVAMLLDAYSARAIFPVCNKERQKELVRSLFLEPASGDEKADVVFECVGSEEVLRSAVDSANPGGHVALVGNPRTDMSLQRDLYWKILRNQLTLHGTWNSSFKGDENDDWHKVTGLLEREIIEPDIVISHRFPLKGLEDGLIIMRDRKEEYGKIMLVNG